MGAPITPICTPFCIGSPEGNPLFFRGEDFLGFFPEPFLGAIAIAAAIIIAIIIAIASPVVVAIAATVIGGTLIRVKVFSFGETF